LRPVWEDTADRAPFFLPLHRTIPQPTVAEKPKIVVGSLSLEGIEQLRQGVPFCHTWLGIPDHCPDLVACPCDAFEESHRLPEREQPETFL
jgi:hypothetical protein